MRHLPIAVLFLAGCHAAPVAEDPLPYADSLPGDAGIYASIPDFTAFLAKIKADPSALRFADEAGFDDALRAFEGDTAELSSLVKPRAAAYARIENGSPSEWVFLFTPRRPVTSGIQQMGSIVYGVRDGVVAVASPDALTRHLGAPVKPPRGVRQDFSRIPAAKDHPYLFISLERWTPPAIAAWGLGWKDCQSLGFSLQPDGAVVGFGEYRPQSFRDVVSLDLQSPRRAVEAPKGIGSYLVQSGPPSRLIGKRANHPALARAGMGWAVAAVPEADGKIGLLAFMETRDSRAAGDIADLLEKEHAPHSPSRQAPGIYRDLIGTHQGSSKPLTVRTSGSHVILATSPELYDSFEQLELRKLLPGDSPEGDHVVMSVKRDSLAALAHRIMPMMARMRGDREPTPESIDALVAGFSWLDSAEWRTRFTDDGAIIRGRVQLR